jgi:type I restriction enzyme S subunit
MKVTETYKQTEVGLIPSDWEVKKLGEVASLKRGKFTPRPRNNPIYYGGEIPFVQTGDVTKSNGKIINYTQTLNKEGLAVSTLFNQGTILMTIAANIGYTGILQIDMACPDSLVAINGLEEMDNSFLNFYFSFRREKLEELATTGAQMNLNIERLSPFQIPLPPTKAEQTAIATALSDADALISGLEKLIVKKRNIKQGAMQKLLQPKEGWEMKKLGEVGTIVTGSTPPTQIQEYWNGSIPWITPTDILNNQKDIFHSEREITNIGLQVIRKLPSNTLLVTCIASIGKNAILRNDGACNQQINAIIPYPENNVDYLYFLIENSKSYLIGKAGITATMMISKKEFSEITYSLPNLKEQTRIASILSDMDAEISALETKLEKYRKVKLGMMQNLLTGKIRLV